MIFISLFIGFCVGVVFTIVLYPILSGFAEITLAWMEVIKAKCSVKITNCSKQIQEIKDELNPSSSFAIGFTSGEDYSEEDEDDD